MSLSGVFRRLVFIIIILSSLSCGSHVHHRVERGETLYSIGFYYGQDYKDIAQWNNIEKPYSIQQGQWLRVAPPNNEWWEEQLLQKTQAAPKSNNRTIKRPENKTKNNKLANRRVVAVEDVIDKAPPVERWIWPTSGKLLKSSKTNSALSNGIKIVGNRGQPIVATASGKVVYSGSGLVGYGKLIIIKHNNEYLSAYAHNQTMLVREGKMVRQGQKIALMGSTRDDHTLLHFEIRKNGKPVDPLRLLDR